MIGILAAMQVEVDAIIQHMQVTITVNKNDGIVFWEGTIHHKEVVVGKSMVGGNYASMMTTYMIDMYHPDAIINIGTAGGLQEYEEVLDVIISDKIAKHDYDTSTIDPDIPMGFNDQFPLVFQTDKKLQQLAQKTMQELSDSHVYVGHMVTGDKFISLKKDVDYIKMYFPEALCGDMEACSVAQVCNWFDVPFVVIRSLSDIAVKEGNGMQFMEYVAYASKRSADFVVAFLAKL